MHLNTQPIIERPAISGQKNFRKNKHVKTVQIMKSFRLLTTLSISLLLLSCGNDNNDYDATGSFEATEIIVSAQANGRILSINLNEGDRLQQGQMVGVIDSTQLYLQKTESSFQCAWRKGATARHTQTDRIYSGADQHAGTRKSACAKASCIQCSQSKATRRHRVSD